jgi:predicted flap endonuclease-1-like 5' DNA nuclease
VAYSSNAPKRARLVSASWAIAQLPGLATDDATRLIDHEILTTLDLLKLSQTQDKRNRLATHLQVPIRQLNKWVALADLARIPSVGCEYAGLLLHAGIASPTQLAQTSIAVLHRQLLRLHVSTMRRRDLCPSTDSVGLWIQQAKHLCVNRET